MPTSLQALLRELSGDRPAERSSDAKILRTLVCLTAALVRTGLNRNQFAARFMGDDEDGRSGLIYRWLDGEVAARETSLRQIDKKLPPECRITDLLDLPLFQLLDNGLTLWRVRKLLKPYENAPDSFLRPWRFPNDDSLRAAVLFCTPTVRWDSDTLYQRGDVYAFTVIVGLVREAELKPDPERHLFHSKNMFRTLPAVARMPEFRPHYELLKRCVANVIPFGSVTRFIYDVDWRVIERQVNADHHETSPSRYRLDPKTFRPIVPEDPIVPRVSALES